MSTRKAAIREAFLRILKVLTEYEALNITVELHGIELSLHACSGELPVRSGPTGRVARPPTGRPRGRPPGRAAVQAPNQNVSKPDLPSAEDLFQAIKKAGSAGISMTAMAKNFGVKPRYLLKPLLENLVDIGSIRKTALQYKAGAKPKRGRGAPKKAEKEPAAAKTVEKAAKKAPRKTAKKDAPKKAAPKKSVGKKLSIKRPVRKVRKPVRKVKANSVRKARKAKPAAPDAKGAAPEVNAIE